MKLLVHLLWVLALQSFLPSSARADQPRATGNVSQKISVGVATPLTGDAAAPGTDVKNALLFANHYFFNDRYDFVFEDDRCEARPAITAAEKLTSIDKAKYVLGMVCNTALLAAAPIYSRAGTIVLTSGATTGDVTGVGDTIFRLYPADQKAAIVLYRDMASRHKRIGILTQAEQCTELMERTFRIENKRESVISKLKSPELFVEQVVPNDHDFKSALLRLTSHHVDALFLNAAAEAGYIEMVKQLHSLRITVPHYAYVLPGSQVTREALGDSDSGTRYSDMTFAPAGLSRESKAIYEAFVAKYGQPNSAPMISVLAIDSLRLLDAALNSGKKPEVFLRAANFQGLAGPIGFDSDGAVNTINFSMHEIKNGDKP